METTVTILSSLLSALIGALAAFWFQNRAEKKRDKKQVLAVIMAYRGRLSAQDDFVKAINMIDIVYHDNKLVRSLFRQYLAQLDPSVIMNDESQGVLIKMILEMCKDVDYEEFTEDDILRFYLPQWLVEPNVVDLSPMEP